MTKTSPTALKSDKGDNSENKRVIVNMNFFKELTMGDADFEKDLLMIFKESYFKNTQKMEEALRDSDNQGWCIACHALKGGSNAIGASDLAAILEHGQKNPKESDQVKIELLRRAREEYGVVIKFLASKIAINLNS